eukprot:scaffold5826_cov113-Skeletonema_menzelii.AAC.1
MNRIRSKEKKVAEKKKKNLLHRTASRLRTFLRWRRAQRLDKQDAKRKKKEEERLHKTARELYNDPSVRLTNGLVFGQGGGVLNNDLLDATRARIEANDEASPSFQGINLSRQMPLEETRIDRDVARTME